MRKNKMIGIAIWLMFFGLVNVLAFCLTRGFTVTFWIAMGFVWVAFLSVLISQMLYWGGNKSENTHVLKVPSVLIGILYLAFQFPVCIIFSLGANMISMKASLIVNLIIMIFAWVLTLLTLWDTKR